MDVFLPYYTDPKTLDLSLDIAICLTSGDTVVTQR
jgi:hypothetical protein